MRSRVGAVLMIEGFRSSNLKAGALTLICHIAAFAKVPGAASQSEGNSSDRRAFSQFLI
jgi:hypothetical protein